MKKFDNAAFISIADVDIRFLAVIICFSRFVFDFFVLGF